jgi:hypothetical protein
MRWTSLKKVAQLWVLIAGCASFLGVSPVLADEEGTADGEAARTVYIPFVTSGVVPAASDGVLLGVYAAGYLGQKAVIDNEVKAIDAWSDERNSLVGTFIALEDPTPSYNVPVPLGLMWDNGYTPFVNIMTSHSLREINNGSLDGKIREFARAFRTWRQDGADRGQNRRAFAAILPEMENIYVPYYGSPDEYKRAFIRIQDIFKEVGADKAVRWVFAPMGWKNQDTYSFEEYYPGSSRVEATGFSIYNGGFCPSVGWKQWYTPDELFTPIINRLTKMAPAKPIFLAQFATTAYAPGGYSEKAKDDWLRDAYTYLANHEQIVGALYFNLDKECDWAFYQPSGRKLGGYVDGVSHPNYVYSSPAALVSKSLAR